MLCIVQEDKSSLSNGPVKDNKCALQYTRGQDSWSHGLVKELSKITSVLCIVQEDKSSLSHGPVKDNKCALQCTRGQE